MKKLIITLAAVIILSIISFTTFANSEKSFTYDIYNCGTDVEVGADAPLNPGIDGIYEDIRKYGSGTSLYGKNNNANEFDKGAYLRVGYADNCNWVSFMRFPLSVIPEDRIATSVKLSVTVCDDLEISSSQVLKVYGGFTATALGDAITYGNKTFENLTAEGKFAGSYTLSKGSYTSGTVLEIDITDYVAGLIEKGAESADLALAMPERDINDPWLINFYNVTRYTLGDNALKYKPHITVDTKIDNTPALGVEYVYAHMRESENPVSGYSDDESHCLQLSVGLNNNTSADVEDAMIIAALYEENDNDMVAVAFDNVSISAKSNIEHNFKLDYKYNGDLYKKYNARFFCLDGQKTLVPLSTKQESYYIPVEYLTTTDLTPWLKSYQFVDDTKAQEGLATGIASQLIYSLDISPFDNNVVLLGTNTAGFYRSLDGGDSFEYSTDGLPYGFIYDVLFDPNVEGTVYAVCSSKESTALEDFDTYQNMGIYKSVNNGKTWEISLPAKYMYGKLGGRNALLSFNYNDENYIFAATGASGIWRSADCGETWQQVYDGTEKIYDICDGQKGCIVAAGEKGLLVSTDGGTSWTLENVIVDDAAIILTGISVSASGDCWLGNTETGIYFKDGTAGTWYKDSRNISYTLISAKFSSFSDDVIYLMFEQLSRPFRYMFRSENTGIYKFLTDDDIYVDNIESGYWGTCYCSAEDGRLWYWSGDFIYSPDGLGNTKILLSRQRVSGQLMTDMHFDEDGTPRMMSAVDRGLYAAEDNNPEGILYPTARRLPLTKWDGATSSSQIAVDPRDSNHMLAVTGRYGYSGGTAVVQSSDGFTTATGQSIVYGDASATVTVVEFHSQNPDIIYAGYKRSDDNGVTWKSLYLENDNPETTDTDEGVLAHIRDMSKKNNDKLLTFRNKTLYISTDRGETWTQHTLASLDGAITCARFDLFDDNVVWVSGLSSINVYNYATGYFEIDWDEAGKTCNIREIVQNPNNKNHLLAINNDIFDGQSVPCLYESTDGGASWKAVEGIPAISYARYIVFNPVEPVAYLGTYLGTLVYDYDCYHKMKR